MASGFDTLGIPASPVHEEILHNFESKSWRAQVRKMMFVIILLVS